MSDAPELNGTETLQSLCAAVGAAVGGSVAGPFGSVIGGFAGRLLHRIITNPEEVALGIGVNFVYDRLKGGFGGAQQRIRARFTAKPQPEMIDALQAALGQALKAAVMDIGGPSCFKAELKNAPQIPAGIIYRDTPSGSQLWRDNPPLAAQIDDLLRHLSQRIGEPATPNQAVDARDVLDVTSPELLASEFYEQVAAPWLTKHRDVLNEADGFAKHLQTHLFSRTLAHLGEALKTDTPVWRTFNRWIMEEMRAELHELGAGQDEIIRRLDAILGFEDKLADVSRQLAEQFVMWGNTKDLLATGFAELSDRHDKHDADLAEVIEGQKRIEDVIGGRAASGAIYVGVPSSRRELIGRKSLLDGVVKRLLSGEHLALYGRGGVGKTALAIGVANDPRIHAHFADGVLWAGLGTSPNVAEVLDRWGRALGIDVSQYVELFDRAQAVKDAVGARRFLLIIDDCWDADTAKLLRCGGPNSAHLMTARFPGLARKLAGHKHTQEVKKLNNTDAHRLLRDLAPEAWKTDAAAVRELAAAVDYVPLALELMGNFLAQPDYTGYTELTQAGLATLTEPRARLELAQERLGQPERKPTWAEVIELSLTGLPEEAVAAFYALGAFAPQPARFDTAAAMAVLGCSLRELSLLQDRGLLEKDKVQWLSIHQTIADVAKLKLIPDITVRHRDYYLKLVADAFDDYQRIETAYSQIQHAWKALPATDARIYDFCNELGSYQALRGHWPEREQWLEKALALAHIQQNRRAEGTTLGNLGVVYQSQGRWEEAIDQHEASLAVKRSLGDFQGEGHTLNNLGNTYQSQGRWTEAIEHYEASLAIKRTLGDWQGEATALNNLGNVYKSQGRWTEANEQYRVSLQICRTLGDRHGEAIALGSLGLIYHSQGRWVEAIEQYQASLMIFRSLGDRQSEGIAINNLSNVLQSQGLWDEAIEQYQASLAICRALRDRQGEATALNNLGAVYHSLGRWVEAITLYETSLLIKRALGDRQGEGGTLINLGIVYRSQGRWAEAIEQYEASLVIFRALGDRHGEGQTLNNLGVVYQAQGDETKAQAYFMEALSKLHPDSPEYRNLRRDLGLNDGAQDTAS